MNNLEKFSLVIGSLIILVYACLDNIANDYHYYRYMTTIDYTSLLYLSFAFIVAPIVTSLIRKYILKESSEGVKK